MTRPQQTRVSPVPLLLVSLCRKALGAYLPPSMENNSPQASKLYRLFEMYFLGRRCYFVLNFVCVYIYSAYQNFQYGILVKFL